MARGWKRCVRVVIVIAFATGFGVTAAAAAAPEKNEDERREYERFVDKVMGSIPSEDLAEDLVQVIHRTMDSEKRERKKKELAKDFDTNDEALLERVGRLLVQWVNNRLTPRTDDECDWSWGRWRCDPQCDCEYKYRFGDYAPGRSCRLRPEEERGLRTCDPEAGNDVSLLEKLGSLTLKATKRAWRFTSEHVIPQTDKECRFSVTRSMEEKRPVCTPRKSCSFKYKFGDLHPGRSCRLREPGDEYNPRSRGRPAKNGKGSGSSGKTDGERGRGWSMFGDGDTDGSRHSDDDYDDSDLFDFDDDHDTML